MTWQQNAFQSCLIYTWWLHVHFQSGMNIMHHTSYIWGWTFLLSFTEILQYQGQMWSYFNKSQWKTSPLCQKMYDVSWPRNLKGGIGSLFDPCVNAVGRRPYCPSRMEVSYCTIRFGAIIRRDLRTLSVLHDSPCNIQHACVIWVHAGKATPA